MADEGNNLEVAVTTIGGEQLVALRLDPRETVSTVKWRVQEEFGYPEDSQQLLQQGGDIVEGERLLASLAQPIVLSLVLVPFDKAKALFQAAQAGHEAAVRSLLFRVASGCEERRNLLLATGLWAGETALVLAAESGRDMTCRALLESAPDAEVQREMLAAADFFGDTALLRAAGRGHEGACRALLERAPSLDARTEMLAVRSGTIFACGMALHRAAAHGHEMASQVLLELAPNPEVRKEMLLARNASGATALLSAAESDHEAACRQLLQVAQSLEVQEELLAAEDDEGRTALQLASSACRLLLGSS